MTQPFIGVLRFIGFVLWTLLAVWPYLLATGFGRRQWYGYVVFYFRMVARICGFQLVTRGHPVIGLGPVLFVANHASYLDIIILGALLPATFVAKAEVAGWPGFGALAGMVNTVFVDRARRASAKESNQVRGRLERGQSLIVFPEGTSNDGNRVLPFKSTMFVVAEQPLPDGTPVVVQPVSVGYTRLDGIPLSRAFRPYLAWYGDMTLAGHLLAALGLGRVTVEITYHDPVTIVDFPNRKALANHCHDVVSHGLSRLLSGRQVG